MNPRNIWEEDEPTKLWEPELQAWTRRERIALSVMLAIAVCIFWVLAFFVGGPS